MTTRSITLEHTVVASERSFDEVIQALETQLGTVGDWEAIGQRLV